MAFELPQVRAGSLDRAVTLLRYRTTVNELYEPVETYVAVATLRARVQHMRVTEIYDANSFQAMRNTKFFVRYRSDVTERDRLMYEGDLYRIRGINEMGRRELLEILAEWMEGVTDA